MSGIDNSKIAIKRSPVQGHEDLVLHRASHLGCTYITEYTPEEAIKYGEALIAVGTEIIAGKMEADGNDPYDPRRLADDASE